VTEFEKALLKELRGIRKALKDIAKDTQFTSLHLNDIKENVDTITDVYLKVNL
jgi:hypothetical protein